MARWLYFSCVNNMIYTCNGCVLRALINLQHTRKSIKVFLTSFVSKYETIHKCYLCSMSICKIISIKIGILYKYYFGGLLRDSALLWLHVLSPKAPPTVETQDHALVLRLYMITYTRKLLLVKKGGQRKVRAYTVTRHFNILLHLISGMLFTRI